MLSVVNGQCHYAEYRGAFDINGYLVWQEAFVQGGEVFRGRVFQPAMVATEEESAAGNSNRELF